MVKSGYHSGNSCAGEKLETWDLSCSYPAVLGELMTPVTIFQIVLCHSYLWCLCPASRAQFHSFLDCCVSQSKLENLSEVHLYQSFFWLHHTECWEALNLQRKGVKVFGIRTGSRKACPGNASHRLLEPLVWLMNGAQSVHSPVFLGQRI